MNNNMKNALEDYPTDPIWVLFSFDFVYMFGLVYRGITTTLVGSHVFII